MARKWPIKPVDNVDGKNIRRKKKESDGVAPFRGSLNEVEYSGYFGVDYGIYDTLLVPYSRYPEFKRLMHDKPVDERSKIVGRSYVPHNIVYYADSNGFVSKFEIKDDE